MTLKAYYVKQDAESAVASGDSRQKLILMRLSTDSLKKSADALNSSSLWEKKKIKKTDEETGEKAEVSNILDEKIGSTSSAASSTTTVKKEDGED